MERNYDYMGYAIRVSTDSISEPVLRQMRMSDSGYIAMVSIFKPDSATPCFPDMRLMDLGDRWFRTEVDALMRGYSVGRRIVEEALGKRAAA
ncbi:hypothetical protein G3N59_02495 [Paraburkholderia sp. Ac-20340]|uniref:hypothetical protein n=1 Tax=Paraburkholderia sp. Ac-20340 TaxID=2703888 RepID=UPI0019811DB7|nr:hypothetical protein [Paraburkholderia sp. Ac-20340]MBN3852242.1 hypothetical protein [Paraburkholderia sp. Ac-20340]